MATKTKGSFQDPEHWSFDQLILLTMTNLVLPICANPVVETTIFSTWKRLITRITTCRTQRTLWGKEFT